MSLGNQQQNTNPNPNHRTLTGFVTKLVGDGAIYGFINDEIFFQQAKVASGGPASVGDQVFVECEYSANLPIKWNATTVKILNKGSTAPSSDPRQTTDQLNVQFNPQQGQNATFPPSRDPRQQQHQQLQHDQGPPTDMSQQQQQPQPTRLLPDPKPGMEFNYASQDPRVGGRLLPASITSNQSEQGPPTHQSPMGPPSFAPFSSPMGTPFVQPNQFAPTPFLAQQPPGPPPAHILSHQQAQHLLPHGNSQVSQGPHVHHGNQPPQHNNQRSNMQPMGGNRFINDNKPEVRVQGNRGRNQNRNENKFNESPRSTDRDGSQSRQNKICKDSKDNKVVGKRDDTPTQRSSSSSSQANQGSSDKNLKQLPTRRHYETINIPKTTILSNINAYNIKQRCPTSVHVPSDLKEVFVNKHFKLDLRNIPKPLQYRIEPTRSSSNKDDPNDSVGSKGLDDNTSTTENIDTSVDDKNDTKSLNNEQSVSSSSKTDMRLYNKYGVKLVILSLPDLQTIYQHLFGPNMDSFGLENGIRAQNIDLDEVIKLVCGKGSSNGYCLIGGKFDPQLDGFVKGASNRFERNNRQPDLIATCKRVMLDQLGLDMTECQGWTLLSTFIYNNKSDYFSSKASIEYSYIYIPHIWTMKNENIARLMSENIISNQEAEQDVISEDTNKSENKANITEDPNKVVQDKMLDLSDLSEEDLKKRLDENSIKFEETAEKTQLISLLEDFIKKENNSLVLPSTNASDTKTNKKEVDSNLGAGDASNDTQLEEGEVISSAGASDCEAELDEPISSKRKAQDDGISARKKHVPQLQVKVDLMKDAFVIRPKDTKLEITTVPLQETYQPARYDQFELSVVSNILKESLVQHFSEYILTALVEDFKKKKDVGAAATSTPSSTSSQDTNSDSNNNTKSLSGKANESMGLSREYPVARYINLAFTYFDANQQGFIQSEDLSKLFNNTGLTISKRALMSLIGEGDKFFYRSLPDLPSKLPPTYVFEFPAQFNELSGLTIVRSGNGESKNEESSKESDRMIEYKGATYDLDKLIREARDAEAQRVSMVDRFNFAIENSDKQAEEIHVLEVSRNSLAKAIKSQNDEICELKRERDSMKKKVSASTKYIILMINKFMFRILI